MEQSLHSLVKSYRESGKGLDLIFESIAGLLYRNPERFGFEGADDAAEALLRYRQRIRGLADRYEDTGASFEAYLTASLRFIARTMRRNRKRLREKEVVCEKSEIWKAEERIDEGCPIAFPLDPHSPLEFRLGQLRSSTELSAFKARLVFLYLKCAWDSDDEKTRLVASISEVPVDWLAAATAQALRSLEAERLRYENLSARRNRAWSRLRLLEGRLRDESDAAGRERIALALEKEKTRFENARAELSSFRPVVPNSIVARLLGIPKGTVDSGLYYLRKKGLVIKL